MGIKCKNGRKYMADRLTVQTCANRQCGQNKKETAWMGMSLVVGVKYHENPKGKIPFDRPNAETSLWRLYWKGFPKYLKKY